MEDQNQFTITNIKLTQKPDCCDYNEDYQYLEIIVEDGGGGPFVVFSTKRWAIDVEELDKHCDDIRKLVEQYKKANLF